MGWLNELVVMPDCKLGTCRHGPGYLLACERPGSKVRQQVLRAALVGPEAEPNQNKSLAMAITLLYYILHTTYYILHTTYYVLSTTYYILHTTYYILHTTYYILRTTYYILHTTYYILHTTYYILHTTYYILHTTYYILHIHTAYYILHTTYYKKCKNERELRRQTLPRRRKVHPLRSTQHACDPVARRPGTQA